MNRSFFKLLGMSIFAITLFSCRTYKESVVIGDVIGFSDDVQTSFKKNTDNPYNLLNDQDKIIMDEYIRNIPAGQNTVGYYALDVALDRVKYIRERVVRYDPEMKYYILLLTDGLDNGSIAAAAQHHKGTYRDTEKYIKRLDKKKKLVMGGGKRQDFFKIYPILFTKGDLELAKDKNNMSDEDFDVFTRNIMEGYRGASVGLSKPEPIAGDNLDELVEKLKEELYTINEFVFHVPRGYVNKRVRMNIIDKTGLTVYIEGKLVKNGSTYEFRDITCSEGLNYYSVDKTIVKEKPNRIKEINPNSKGLLSLFTIGDLSYNGKRLQLEENNDDNIEQQVEEYGIFTTNSEYKSQAESRYKTYVMMIIDGSKSFEQNSELAKQKAIEMRDVILEKGKR